MTNPSRGDIVWVNFPEEGPDAEMDGGPHMAVVVQNDGCNERFDSTVVVPITSGTSRDRLTEVDIPSHDEPVDDDSIAVIRQIQTVSVPKKIHDAGEDPAHWKQGELSAQKMHEIEGRIATLLRVS